ncbi:acyltransferase family protein [Geodermatophilus sp. SYSU D01062]
MRGASTGSPRRDIRALTGLRAVAATWVMLFHLQVFLYPYLDQVPFVLPLVRAGWTGVELFFVLSGFVITLSYGETMGGRPTPRRALRFVINRFARVWPAWAVVTVAMGGWIYLVRASGHDADVVGAHPDADLPTLLSQLTMTQMWGRTEHMGASYVGPGWSISAEWAAYLAFPVLIVALWWARRLPAAVLLVLAVAVMSPLSVDAFLHGTPDTQQHWALRITCGFTAGVLAALAVRRTERSDRTESVAFAAQVSCVALIVTGTMWALWRRGDDLHVDYAGVIVVLFPALVAALAVTDRGPARWLSTSPLVYGGKISYCLYLVHFVMIDIAVALFWQDPAGRGTLTPGQALLLPLLVVVAFSTAAGLHHGVEEPARRLVLAAADRVLVGTVRVPRGTAAAPVPPPAEPMVARPDLRTARLVPHAGGTLSSTRRSDGNPVRPAWHVSESLLPAAGRRVPVMPARTPSEA